MGMDAKPLAGLQEVVIKGYQCAKGALYRVGIVAEAEEEIAFQPADVFDASFGRGEEKGLHIVVVTGLKMRLFAWSISSCVMVCPINGYTFSVTRACISFNILVVAYTLSTGT